MFNTRIIFSGLVVTVSAAFIIGAAFALFSDTETSSGNVLAAGALDLQIDNTSYYNGVLNEDTTWDLDDLTDQLFFDFTDVKPNDWGEDTISLHAENDSWVCADFTLTSNLDNSCNAEEEADEPACQADDIGELGENIEFVFWADDGDNVLETDEEEDIITQGLASDVLDSEMIIADSQTNNLGGDPGDPLTGGLTQYIAKAWCFGDLTLEPLEPGEDNTPANSTGGVVCNGDLLDNSTQTDSITADIQFSAVQSRNNPGFVCTPEEEFSCEQPNAEIFAGSVLSSLQGLLKNGNSITDPNRTDPAKATGAPQTAGLANDAPVPAGSFFSVGFPHANNLNTPGSIDLDMGQIFYPVDAAPDLFVYEVTGGTYPIESVQVYAKLNLGDSWSLLGTVDQDEGVELSGGGLTSARYVRLVEASNLAPFEPTADGFDLGAVKAFCQLPNNNF